MISSGHTILTPHLSHLNDTETVSVMIFDPREIHP